jgi:hypothetical protein
MSQVTQALSRVFTGNVLPFATEQGVAAYLDAVLEMTQRLFPSAKLSVRVDDDPEIADDRHMVVSVAPRNMEVPEALENRYRWHRELFACCPAPLVSIFRLDLELTDD